MSDKAITSTTQEFLDVYDIVNDMVILKDASVSIILQIGTMNFSLLAEQEQDAVIFTYGSLLNSLNYPIQINIQSQTKDATKYLRLLDEQAAKASSDRKSALIKQYRGFVESLIKERNVLQKRFYIVTTAGSAEMGLISPSGLLPGQNTFNASSIEKSILLEKAANILEPRREHLIAQFNRLGLFARQLNTQEIIQNFYINYNPEAAEGQEISSSENYTTPLVRASFGGTRMQISNPVANSMSQASPSVTPPTPPIPPAPTIDESNITTSSIGTTTSPEAQGFTVPADQIPTSTPSVVQEEYKQPQQDTATTPPETASPVTALPTETQTENQLAINQAASNQIAATETLESINVSPMLSAIEPQFSQPQTDSSLQQAPPTEINLNLDQNLLKQEPLLEKNQEQIVAMNPATETNVVESNASIDPSSQTMETPVSTEPDFSEEIMPIQNIFDTDENPTT